MLAAVEAGKGVAFAVDRARLADAADLVAKTTAAAYPDGLVPPHSRWRHFETPGGRDMWAEAADAHDWTNAADRARAEIDLAFVSVFLDAGAGSAWRYQAKDGRSIGRSEGLAAASLDMFLAGAFSGDPDRPWQADATGIARLDADALMRGLQSGPWAAEPGADVIGLDGRLELLANLAAALDRAPDLFGPPPGRPGGVYDWALKEGADAGGLLTALADRLAPIWPDGTTIRDRPCGDVWPLANAPEGYAPFHKLTQWLVYSLTEPFARAGRPLGGVERLTGLAEYRNGGLFADLGVIRPLDPTAAAALHQPGDPFVVEWRAVTVALLDDLLPLVRDALGAPGFTLAQMLQGGAWSAGRALAAERRPGAAPPFRVASRGALF